MNYRPRVYKHRRTGDWIVDIRPGVRPWMNDGYPFYTWENAYRFAFRVARDRFRKEGLMS